MNANGDDNNNNEPSHKKHRKKPDLYRDTPVRYLGYTNEVGEAFRSIIGRKWVNVSYGIATAYVLADTSDKSAKSYKANKLEQHHFRNVAFTTMDTLIWQLLASVAVPGFTINRVCALGNYLLKRTKLPKTNRKLLVTAVGLAVIPFIIRPIDRMVDVFMDETVRKFEPKNTRKSK